MTDNAAQKVYAGLVLFVALIGMAFVMRVVAERVTKRRYGFGITGFRYRL